MVRVRVDFLFARLLHLQGTGNLQHTKKVHKKFRKNIKSKTNSKSDKILNTSKYSGQKKNSTKVVRQNSINILTTNAASLKQKAYDLQNKIKHFKSSIFTVQETHYTKKGKFKIDNFVIFEAIRKSKIKGGSLLGVHMDLKPVLIKEYSEDFELIVVEITTGNNKIRLFTGYGPQENWDEHKRIPFFDALESEVAAAELEGRSVIMSMDANSNLGYKYIPEDLHVQSKNGKMLADIMDRHALSTVVNGLQQKCVGVITRERHTVEGIEKSVIDFVIISSDLNNHLEYMHIDDQRVNVLTKLVKTKKGKRKHIKKVESDHNLIDSRLSIPWNILADEPIEVFNLKDKES